MQQWPRRSAPPLGVVLAASCAMSITSHITLVKPDAKVAWSVSERELLSVLASANPKTVVPGQLKATCALTKGLSGECRFHFDKAGRLRKLQLERTVPRHRQKSFDAWNVQLEAWLNRGMASVKRSESWCEWTIGKLKVVHISHSDGVERVEVERS